MVGIGRGRAWYISQMRRDMKILQRKVEDLTNVLDSQRIIQREMLDEGIVRGDVDRHTKHQEEQLECMTS
jgi:hypothetical protein